MRLVVVVFPMFLFLDNWANFGECLMCTCFVSIVIVLFLYCWFVVVNSDEWGPLLRSFLLGFL